MGFLTRIKELFTGKKTPPLAEFDLVKLFETALRQSAPPAAPLKPKMSLLKMLMDQNVDVEYQVCPLDGNTSPIVRYGVWIYGNTTTIHQMPPDVGGFCSKCNANRCAAHSIYVAMTLSTLRQSGGEDLIPDASILQKVAEITKQPVDTVFILGCRTCNGSYDGQLGMRQIVLT